MEIVETARWQTAEKPLRLAVARALVLLCAGWHVEDVLRFLPELVGEGAALALPQSVAASAKRGVAVGAEGDVEGHAAISAERMA
jgi:hypothetical protein